MPITLAAGLASHLAGETLTLATLWKLTRRDGTVYFFTDHDRDITFDGDVYLSGQGYARTAIEDKSDFSSDNLNVNGVIDAQGISREDVRAGLFDGAEVVIRIVNYTDPTASIIRRRGWLGEVKQNNLGQFSTELRGLSEALSETLSVSYTPGCRVDLGSAACGLVMAPDGRVDATAYTVGDVIALPEYPNLQFECTTAGTSADASTFDIYAFDVHVSATVGDGSVVWTARNAWRRVGVVQAAPTPDRRTFHIAVDEDRLDTNPRWYDGGVVKFLTGANAGIAREVKFYDSGSDGLGQVDLYLRMPFNIDPGDTLHIWPGCAKNTSDCKNKFDNLINYQGFPHVPGDDYLKNYPDAKP